MGGTKEQIVKEAMRLLGTTLPQTEETVTSLAERVRMIEQSLSSVNPYEQGLTLRDLLRVCNKYTAKFAKGGVPSVVYEHERQERSPSKHPMNTEWPERHPAGELSEVSIDYLRNRNLSVSIALHNGWYSSSNAGDDYCRIVIPATTHKQGHVYWQARAVGDAYIRYQSPKGPRHEAIVVVRPFRSKGNVVVEGPMCALSVAAEGYTGYALMGMQPNKATLYHLALLLDEDKHTVVLLDRDSMAHAIPVAAFLAANGHSVVRGLIPSPEKDLAECSPDKRRSILNRYFPR